MKIRTWIVIADGARAHIVKNEGIGSDKTRVSARGSSRRSTWTRPRMDRAEISARHAVEQRVDWHRFEKHRFAAEMAGILNREAGAGAFDRLVLVAPPEILGVLRGAINEPTRKLITAEPAKDLTHEPISALPRRLRELVNL